MPLPQTIPAGKVIPLPTRGERASQRILRDDVERGRILLFTGVRYERMVEDADESVAELSGRPRRDHDILS